MKAITHAFVTFDDTHFLLTADDHARLMRVGDKDFFKAGDGSEIRGSAIKAILPIKSYYEKYPDRVPVTTKAMPDEYTKLLTAEEFGAEPVSVEATVTASKRRLHTFVKALKEFVEAKGGPNSRAMLASWLKRYQALYGPFIP